MEPVSAGEIDISPSPEVSEILCQADRILYSKGITNNEKFDLNTALELVKQGARIDGKNGVPTLLIKQLTATALSSPKL